MNRKVEYSSHQRCCRGGLKHLEGLFWSTKTTWGHFRGTEGASKIGKILLFHRKNQYLRRKSTIFKKIFLKFFSKKIFLRKKIFFQFFFKNNFFPRCLHICLHRCMHSHPYCMHSGSRNKDIPGLPLISMELNLKLYYLAFWPHFWRVLKKLDFFITWTLLGVIN